MITGQKVLIPNLRITLVLKEKVRIE